MLIRWHVDKSIQNVSCLARLLTCLNVNNPFSGFRTTFGGVSGRRGLSGPISDPLDSESCILSRALLYVKVRCFRRCKRVISSRIFCAIFSVRKHTRNKQNVYLSLIWICGQKKKKTNRTICAICTLTVFEMLAADGNSRRILPGVSFVQLASLKADGVGSTVNLLAPGWLCAWAVENGLQRLRLGGRWFNDSQSSDRFNVAHAILIVHLVDELIIAYS